ncbi:phosphonopyruvate decarboxylase [Paracidovorax konjaci]|uniref:Phosphonopyruvate decarboxylase n=1 Tax=Paracidovorax konjaci TaxID=32040 RepID=A0A1I1U188_9BURK|nr:phosphonopyruvate decarboxylase [Paracidovorax konjaci]SFD64587.1 phosphonopyruvate decarboxylase [Paracidovorax konjaci]
MISGMDFVGAATRQGFDFYVSVPCSYLTPLLNGVLSDAKVDHIMAASEGEAIGIAAGAYLGGRLPVVMMQNSGLGNAVNPLTSLNHIFKIPSLLICSWRGSPGVPDEPQHRLMGEITHRLLDTLQIPHGPFPWKPELIGPALQTAREVIGRTQLPYALVVDPDVLEAEELKAVGLVRPPSATLHRLGDPAVPLPSREEVLRTVVAAAPPDAGIIATTGKTGRELFCIEDSHRHLYLVGSMGCASAVGLGAALTTDRPIIVLDGDGAALMKLGNLSTIGRYRPASMVHLVIDNGVHDSTGGQPTNSGNIDFAQIASACGYQAIYACSGMEAVAVALRTALNSVGPHFIHVRVRPGSMKNLPRPTVAPQEVGRRFARHLLSEGQPSAQAHPQPAQPIGA